MTRLILCLVAIVLYVPSAFAATDIEFILDVSGSMEKELGGEKQIDSARNALKKSLNEIPAGQMVAIRVYGHRIDKANKAESCKDTELLVPFKEVDKGEINLAVGSLQPKGYTPIAHSLEQARNDLYDVGLGRESERVVILLTDGEETCGGDPLAVLRKLKAEGFNVTVYTIGFNVNDVARKQLKEIADFSGGKYFDANNSQQLNNALKEATQQSLVLDKKKTIYGSEIRGGDDYASAVPMVMDKEVRLDHHQKKNFYDYFYVDLEGGEEVTVTLNTLEKGIQLRKDGKFYETGGPYSGIEIHDSNRNKLEKGYINGNRNKQKKFTFYPTEKGRYYFLVGSNYSEINKDHATFQIAKTTKGDLDTAKDAGNSVQTAMSVEMKRYEVNHLGGGDKKDLYSFDGVPGSDYFIGIIPQEEFRAQYRVKVFDEFKQVVASGNSKHNEGLKLKEFRVPDQGRYFISIEANHPKGSVPYTLILREKNTATE